MADKDAEIVRLREENARLAKEVERAKGLDEEGLELIRERDRLAKELESAKQGNKNWLDEAGRLTEERDLARAEVERLKEVLRLETLAKDVAESEVGEKIARGSVVLTLQRRAEQAEKDAALSLTWQMEAEKFQVQLKSSRELNFRLEQKVASQAKTIQGLESHLRAACPCVDCDARRKVGK